MLMNFLEAHKIFYNYCGALAKGTFAKSDLPCNGDVERINNAAILVISHFYFFHLGTQQQFDSLTIAAMSLHLFKDEATIQQELELNRYIEKNTKWPWASIRKKEVKRAKYRLAELLEESQSNPVFGLLDKKRGDTTDNFFDKCREERWKRTSVSDIIEAAQYLYSLLGIEFTNLDTHSFFTMQMLRDFKKYFDGGGFLYDDVELNNQFVQLINDNWEYIYRNKV